MKKRLHLLLIFPALLLISLFSVSAQSLTPDISSSVTETLSTTTSVTPTTTLTVSPQVNNLQSSEVSGKVTKIDGDTITIQDSSNNYKELTIPSGIKVTKDNKEASVSDIKVDDNLKATIDGNNQVLSVDVTSKSSLGMLIPAAIIALLVIGLILYFLNKSKQGQIMTSVEKVK